MAAAGETWSSGHLDRRVGPTTRDERVDATSLTGRAQRPEKRDRGDGHEHDRWAGCSRIAVTAARGDDEVACEDGGVPLTNPWLAGPAPETVLPRAQLEERILNLLSSQNMAVVATVSADGSPVASPVRYFSLGFEIFYTSWESVAEVAQPAARPPGLRRDLRAARRAGEQPRSTALRDGPHPRPRDPSAQPYWEALRWQSDHVERGRSLDDPPTDPVTVITPARIVYTEHWLRRTGYAPRQTWRLAD